MRVKDDRQSNCINISIAGLIYNIKSRKGVNMHTCNINLLISLSYHINFPRSLKANMKLMYQFYKTTKRLCWISNKGDLITWLDMEYEKLWIK